MSCNEPLAKSVGANTVLLKDHLCQVADYARAVARAYRTHWERLLGTGFAERVERALVLAAVTHDLGKAAQGFQRSLHSPQNRWEFRHEVLSTALLLTAADSNDRIVRLTAAAVLSHHRHLDDPQLQSDSALPTLPEPDILQIALQKFQSKASELHAYWQWLQDFCNRRPELRSLQLPCTPSEILPPDKFLKGLINESLPLVKTSDETLELSNEAAAYMLARGWLMASDHAASAGVSGFRASLPKPSLPLLRRFQEQIGAHKGDAFLEIPTGAGKTVAAICWALQNRLAGERMFYLLPYQASIEAMAKTLEGFFGADEIAVLHARAIDYAFREYFEQLGEYEAAVSQATAEANLNRLVHKPIKVATPFQLLRWLFGIPRWEIGVSEMVGGLFILDEIHAYDAHTAALIVEMVRVLKQLGGRFLFMSATFPPFLRQLLQKALGAEAKLFRLECTDDWSRQFLSTARHRLQWHEAYLEQLIPQITQAAGEGRRVLVVANRVAQAQKIFRELRDRLGEGVYLLHSRFTRHDRVSKERDIIGTLHGERDLPLRVLVATQVVEVSLDVSFDTIFTEVAPVDDLLQRFGRVNRYGEHSHGVDVHVACQYDAKSLQGVYQLERIEKTLRSAPRSETPLTVSDCEDWVYQTYREGWTKKEQGQFDSASKAFSNVIESLRPLQYASKGEEEFYELFSGAEVLPMCLYDAYAKYFRNKQYLLANQLLVPVPLGTYRKLKNERRLVQANGVLQVDAPYTEEQGLDTGAIDIDWCIVST
ncbi:MAG: CRISPR-associated helicase Cas3' [Armatimonadetes bacterium]|nr:CRISPR-associated helicase Cas3' [Armatimonadota bacterium]